MRQHFLSRAQGALALCLLLPVGFLPAAEVSLRTMSFNVRYAGTVDDQLSGNGWFNSDPSVSRAQKAVQVIRDYGPDILGTQEALSFQLQSLPGQDLASGLADYGYYGVGRENGIAHGEYAAIFYRSDRFTRVDAGTFWLSPTPDVPSIYPGAGSIRIASWVKLDDHLSGQQIFVLNTHLDNVSNTANLYAANLIRDRLPGLAGDAPIVLTGDLNSTETSSVVRTLLGQNDPGGFQLGDAYREVHPTVGANERTFHAYGGGTSGSRIDFILHSDALTPTGASIVRTTYGGKYPSDHYPVTAELTLVIVPEPTGAALILAGGTLLLVATRSRRLDRCSSKGRTVKSLSVIMIVLSIVVLATFQTADAVSIHWTTIGKPGNAPDTVVTVDGTTGHGAVPYTYKISTYEITNSQFAEFLNAKDPSNPEEVWSWYPVSDASFIEIRRDPNQPPGQRYSVTPGLENRPVTRVSWIASMRFANWLQNGQGDGDTETGAYTLAPNGWFKTRNADARIVIPNEDEWYKAAYYDPATGDYFKYPTSSNMQPTPSGPTHNDNSANFGSAILHAADVGSYPLAVSPFGTHDQGGNAWEWLETQFFEGHRPFRLVRGGSFAENLSWGDFLSSSVRYHQNDGVQDLRLGFRVALVPESNSLLLAAFGLPGLIGAWRAARQHRGRRSALALGNDYPSARTNR